jgi:hypothetical protein
MFACVAPTSPARPRRAGERPSSRPTSQATDEHQDKHPAIMRATEQASVGGPKPLSIGQRMMASGPTYERQMRQPSEPPTRQVSRVAEATPPVVAADNLSHHLGGKGRWTVGCLAGRLAPAWLLLLATESVHACIFRTLPRLLACMLVHLDAGLLGRCFGNPLICARAR